MSEGFGHKHIAHKLVPCLLSLLMSVLPIRYCNAENMAKEPLSLVAIGARFGTNAGTDRNGTVDRVDAFGSWRTPYAWEFTPGWDVGARFNASVGVIRSQGDTGAVGTFVPTLAIGDTGNGFSFELGAGAALFSNWEFGTVEDFGGPLQFILDVGVNFRVYQRLGFGYRFQHWSTLVFMAPSVAWICTCSNSAAGTKQPEFLLGPA